MIKQYIDQGIVIIPTYFKSKIPAISWKEFKDTRPTIEQYREWFNGKKRNLALLTGKLSGICAVDFDSIDACHKNSDIFNVDTFTVKSNRGYHKYFKRPSCEVANKTKLPDYPDIDFKMNDSLITAPPSTHESGHKYIITNGSIDKLADLPETVVEICKPKIESKFVTNYDEILGINCMEVLSLPIKMILRDFGLRENSDHGFYCYNGHDKESASLRIYENSNSYCCFGCLQGGNVVNLTSRILKQNYYAAGKYLKLKYNL